MIPDAVMEVLKGLGALALGGGFIVDSISNSANNPGYWKWLGPLLGALFLLGGVGMLTQRARTRRLMATQPSRAGLVRLQSQAVKTTYINLVPQSSISFREYVLVVTDDGKAVRYPIGKVQAKDGSFWYRRPVRVWSSGLRYVVADADGAILWPTGTAKKVPTPEGWEKGFI